MSDSMAKPTLKDWKSTFRHSLIPALAGALVVGLGTLNPEKFGLGPVEQIIATAVLSGIGRFLQRFVTTIQEAPPVPAAPAK